jgi:hypothetical protein
MSWRKSLVLVSLFASVVVSAGCGPGTIPAGATPVGLPPDVAEAARRALSSSIDVPMDQIEIVRANHVEWTDTCLELGERDEVCGQALTPGWRIILKAEGAEYEVHTDLGADTVRLKES